jgi:ABC-type antimicrobial peptide transport system permease subunit
LFVRVRDADPAVLEAVRRVLQGVAPDVPSASVRYVRENISWLTSPLRLGTAVFAAFGILAALIAAVGLAGVLSSLVRQERRAYAVRVALGAPSQKIVAPVVGRAVGVVGAGMVVGFGALVPLRGVFEPMLFRTGLLDAGVVAGVLVLGVLVAAGASVVPVRDVLAIQPMRVLREE